MLILSFDQKQRRGNGMIDGVTSPSKITKIEYPSNEVLKNLDEVFNGESSKYDAELTGLHTKETEQKNEKGGEFWAKINSVNTEDKEKPKDAENANPEINHAVKETQQIQIENSKIIGLEELKTEIQENINKLLENPEAKKFNPKILKFELSKTEKGLNIDAKVSLSNVPVISNVKITLNLDLGNDNKDIVIKKHKISTDNLFATGKVKNTLEPLLPKLIPQIKSYLTDKLGYEIKTLKIDSGELHINK